ncbi:MAG: DUF447 family protein [Euryarchaeota archaeon]|nr:DUF447 family protein [Euryarchaeota archaeon]
MNNKPPAVAEPSDFGILDGISEVIATTASESGIPNAAPIGIIRNDDTLWMRLFPGSHTRRNAIETGEITANIVHDPVVYVEYTFEDPDPDVFEYPDGMSCPVLKHSDAWVLFFCQQSTGNVFKLTPVSGMIRDKPLLCINRGFNAVIESLVHATRYRLNRDARKLDLIEHYDQIVQTCGGLREKEAMMKLKEIIEI